MPVIATDADLLQLRARVHTPFLGPDDRSYEFRHPLLDRQENERLTILLNDAMSACGCNVGSMLMALSAAGSIVYYFLSGGALEDVTLRHWLNLAAMTIAGGVLGKTAGLVHARWKLIRLVRHAFSRIRRPTVLQSYHSPSPEEPWEESAAKPRNG